jgi:hypothetical protein
MSSTPLGLVTIKRRRGRIAMYSQPKVPLSVLWCGTNRPRRKHGQRKNGWSFPPAVRELLLQETQGRTVLHLFGGRADFGIRMDVDPATKPHVCADAFLPPFRRDAFQVVILDPPYYRMNRQEIIALLRAAAWIATEHLYWFHTTWIATHARLPLEQGWLCRVGDQCAIRTLQKFAVREPKLKPLAPGEFTRGEALRYNRWQLEAQRLPFTDFLQIGDPAAEQMPGGKYPLPAARAAQISEGVFLGDWE